MSIPANSFGKLSTEQSPIYSPLSQDYPFVPSKRADQYDYNSSPEILFVAKERGSHGAIEFSSTSSHSSTRSNSYHQKFQGTPLPSSKFNSPWVNPSPKSRFPFNPPTYPNSLDRGISSPQKNVNHCLESPPALDSNHSFKTHGHTKSLSKFRNILECQDDVRDSLPSPGFVRPPSHRGSHQRSYSMLAEPFSRGYCTVNKENTYSFPKSEHTQINYQLTNTPPTSIKSHRRFPSTQLASNSHSIHGNPGDPLFHSFNSRSESGKEVLYFKMPTTPSSTKSRLDTANQTPTRVNFGTQRLGVSHSRWNTMSDVNGTNPHNLDKPNQNGSKTLHAGIKPLSQNPTTCDLKNTTSSEDYMAKGHESLRSKTMDPSLLGLAPKGRVIHKKHRTLGGSFDINFKDESVAPSEKPRLPKELLNSGDETITELYDLLVNYKNPWGTHSVDEGQFSKDAKDDSSCQSSVCEDKDFTITKTTQTDSELCALIIQEHLPKITRVQNWLSQNASPEISHGETISANHSLPSLGADPSQENLDDSLQEFDGDVLIGDFFSSPEISPVYLASDDGSHTHVDSKGSDTRLQHQNADFQEKPTETSPNHISMYSTGNIFVPAIKNDPKVSVSPEITFSSEKTYERRVSTPDFECDILSIASSSHQAPIIPKENDQERSSSLQILKPEDISELDASSSLPAIPLEPNTLMAQASHESSQSLLPEKSDAKSPIQVAVISSYKKDPHLGQEVFEAPDVMEVAKISVNGESDLLNPCVPLTRLSSSEDPCLLLEDFFEKSFQSLESTSSEKQDLPASPDECTETPNAELRSPVFIPKCSPEPSPAPVEPSFLPEITGRFCFDTPLGPRKLVWFKDVQPVDAASNFCSKYGITNPLYIEALAYFLTDSCK